MRCVLPKESTYSGRQLIPTGTTAWTCGAGGLNPIVKGRISRHEVPTALTAFVPAQYLWRWAIMSTGVGNSASKRSYPLVSVLEWHPSTSATPPEAPHRIRANPPLRTPVSGSARRYPPPGHARGTACASETMITGGGRIPGQPKLTKRLHVQESSVKGNAPVHRAAMVPRRGVQISSLPERGNSSLADTVPSLTRPC